MTEKRRVLVIGYCYPPTATPEAFVTAKLLRNIPNYEIDVLTLEDGLVGDYCDIEMGKYAEQISGTVVKVTPSRLTKQLCKLPRLPMRPDRWILANKSVRNEALRLLQNDYSCLITRSQYHSAHLVGLELKRKNPDLPWIACFSDPWSESDHQKHVPIFSRYSQNQEKCVMELADSLIFPTAGLLEHMTKENESLVKKSHTIPHCYDPSLYPLSDRTTKIASHRTQLCWRLFGSFYGSRKPDTLINALALVKIPDNKKVRVEIYGAAHEKYSQLKQFNAEYDDREIAYMGQTPHRNALKLMQTSDLLLVIDGTEHARSFYLPSKIVDYLGSGANILSICRPGTVKDITISRGFSVANIDEVTSISGEMEKILQQSNTDSKHQEIEDIYNANEVGSKFYEVIKSTVQNYQPSERKNS